MIQMSTTDWPKQLGLKLFHKGLNLLKAKKYVTYSAEDWGAPVYRSFYDRFWPKVYKNAKTKHPPPKLIPLRKQFIVIEQQNSPH